MQVAHAQVALLCMCYISAVIKYWPLSDAESAFHAPFNQQTGIALSKSLPLLHYAFSHGFRHLECLGSGNGAVIDGMITLRLDIERHPVEWQRICELAILRLPYSSTSRGRHLQSSTDIAQHDYVICILMFLLPEPFLRAFLRRAPFKALNGTSPLIYAACFGKIEHARTILSCGVSHVNGTGLDVKSPHQILPLEVAFYKEDHSLFDLFLLDWRATVPPRLFSSVFHGRYLERAPCIATKLLQCDEFTEWVADCQCKQSLLQVLDYDWSLIGEQEAVAILRRLVQVGCDFSALDSLEPMLRVTFSAASQRSLALLLYLCSLDVPLPYRVLFIEGVEKGTALVRDLALQGVDVHAIMTHGDNALHRVFGECKHGSSCWSLDCKLCSVFIRAMGPQVSQKFINQYIRFIS